MEIVAERPDLIPEYKTEGSAGMDLKANVTEPVLINSGECVCIPTGLKMSIPFGCEGNMRPRSGRFKNEGLLVEGTIDSDFTGEVQIMCRNISNNMITIYPMERIAQIVIAPFIRVTPKPVAFLKETYRGDGGFGSTGNK